MTKAASSLPLVTVFVGCYNHSRFVVEALESVRMQNYPAVQLLVADDCSQDDSVRVIREWLDQYWPEALLIAHTKNRGVCRTFNELLAHAKGKYICGFSADDVWLPGRLRAHVEFMETQPEEVGVIYGDAYQIDEHGRRLPKMFNAAHRALPTLPDGWIFDVLAEGNFIPAMTTLVRRRCFEVVGTYDETLAIEDWDMWLRIARSFQFRCWPEITANYRVLSTSLMRTQSRAILESGERTLLKCLDWGWLSGNPRKIALGAARNRAIKKYQERHPDWFREIWRCFRLHPSLQNSLLLVWCTIRLPAAWHVGIFNLGRKVLGFARV